MRCCKEFVPKSAIKVNYVHMVKFFSRLPRLGNRASQTSHEHIENFIKVRRDLGNRVIPVNLAEMKISVSKQEKLTFWTLHPGYQNEFFATAHALYIIRWNGEQNSEAFIWTGTSKFNTRRNCEWLLARSLSLTFLRHTFCGEEL